jgi:hypothetical protein
LNQKPSSVSDKNVAASALQGRKMPETALSKKASLCGHRIGLAHVIENMHIFAGREPISGHWTNCQKTPLTVDI